MTKSFNAVENKDNNEINEDNLVMDDLCKELFNKHKDKNGNI